MQFACWLCLFIKYWMSSEINCSPFIRNWKDSNIMQKSNRIVLLKHLKNVLRFKPLGEWEKTLVINRLTVLLVCNIKQMLYLQRQQVSEFIRSLGFILLFHCFSFVLSYTFIRVISFVGFRLFFPAYLMNLI